MSESSVFSTADLSEGAIRSALDPAWRDLPITVFDTVDSTNNEAKRRFADGSPTLPALILADRQTGGRGRLPGRVFHSPSGTGLYLTLLTRPEIPLDRLASVTCAAAVAAARAIRKTVGAEVGIKWVNDLIFDGKKVCGILSESVSGCGEIGLIIGIGINLRPTVFPPELEGIAGSLDDTVTPRARLAAEIVNELFPLLSDPDGKGWIDEYRARSCVLGKTVLCSRMGNDTFPARVEEILADGSLSVIREDGRAEILRSGEISVRLE